MVLPKINLAQREGFCLCTPIFIIKEFLFKGTGTSSYDMVSASYIKTQGAPKEGSHMLLHMFQIL